MYFIIIIFIITNSIQAADIKPYTIYLLIVYVNYTHVKDYLTDLKFICIRSCFDINKLFFVWNSFMELIFWNKIDVSILNSRSGILLQNLETES
jgi:cell shape-determining protein MreD